MADPYRLQRQTQAKHALLRLYLGPWCRILSNAGHTRLLYVDGFSFAGRYTSDDDGGTGGPGSPLIALECFTGDDAPTAKGLFLFCDEDKSTIDELERNIAMWPHRRPTDQIRCRHGAFADAIVPTLETLEAEATKAALYPINSTRWKEKVIPAFVLIDPYGPAGFPMELIARILRLPRTEVFINLMWVRLALNLVSDANASLFDRMFGAPDWRRLRALSGDELRRQVLELYLARLRAADGGNATFVRSFEMCDRTGAPVYWMVFCSNNPYGLEKMKQAMWKVDPGGRFRYRDTTDADQLVMMDGAQSPSMQPLRGALASRFAGRNGVSVEEIEDFVVQETPYLRKHLRDGALKPLEREGKIRVHRTGPAFTYKPQSTTVDFLP